MKRVTRDEALMATASVWAARSTCRRKQVGVAIAKDHRIISIGYNGAPSGMPHCNDDNCTSDQACTRTIHAEINAIVFAARNGISIEGATLYTTLEPCLDCAKAIVNAGITKLVYKERYRSHEGVQFLSEAGVEVEWY